MQILYLSQIIVDAFKVGPEGPDCSPAISHTESHEDILVPVTVLEVKDEAMVS
jgi:hypothetical protein